MIKYGSPEYWKLSLAEKEAIRGRSVTTAGRETRVGGYGTPEYWSAKIAAKQAALRAAKVEPAPLVRGEEYNIHVWQSCDPGYVKRFKPTTKGWYCLRETAAPPTAPPTAPPLPANGAEVECPRGTVYDAPTFGGCDPGYRLEKRWGFDTCICEVRDPYVPEQDKTARDVGLGGLAGIVDMLPTIIIGGIVIAAMGMLKK